MASVHSIRCKVTGEALADKLDGGSCVCEVGKCAMGRFPRPMFPTSPIKRMLPPDCSADIHQIIAKAIYLRFAQAYNQGGLVITRDELIAAADAEFGYDLTADSDLLFRPLTEAEKEL